MKKIILVLLLIALTSNFGQEKKFIKSAETNNFTLLSKDTGKHWCSVCGMNLKMFYKTNHALELDNGTYKQYCSIRCLIADKDNYKNHIKRILVVDAGSEKFVDAQKAFYVVGSSVAGTMSKTSKIAFKSKEDAEKFRIEHGGNIFDFEAVFKLASEQFEKENNLLSKKKEMKIYPKGKKLFSKLCNKDLKVDKFKSIASLKAYIKGSNQCKKINEKQLQMIALYLWDVKRFEKNTKPESQEINVPKIEKCPVCGMFVYKYPKWAAVLEIKRNNEFSKLYFDGVKDLIKFYINPSKWGNYNNIKINKIIVTDYYNQTAIDGKKAVYVIGSDVFGPMGKELIPFENKSGAMAFIKYHGGSVINSFGNISSNTIKMLEE